MERAVNNFITEWNKYYINQSNAHCFLYNKEKIKIRPRYKDFKKLFYEQSDEQQSWLVMGAITFDDVDDFCYVMSLAKNIDIRMQNDIFLKIAVRNKAYNMIKYLLEEGLDVCAGNNFAIKCASMYFPKIDYIKLLIDYGADFRVDNDLPICCAADHSRWNTIKLLVECGSDINAGNGYVIEKIIYGRNSKMLEYAASVGGDMTNCNFVKIAIINSYKCLKILINHGANISTISSSDMENIIKNGHSKIIELLINNGLNFSLVNGYKAAKKSGKTIKNLALLIEAGVDPITICHLWSETNNQYGTSSGDSSNEESFSEMNSFSD